LDEVIIFIKKTRGAEDLPIPRYMTALAAGMDLLANVSEEICIAPGEIKTIPCGIQLELPPGYEGQIRPRSGLAAKYGITVLNSPGTVDADYRGEIKVILINLGKISFRIKRGDRIAQLVISKVVRGRLIEKSDLSDTDRGIGGFGHTGI